MDVFVGSSTGVIKGVNLADNSCINLNFSSALDKQDENIALCWYKCPPNCDNDNVDQTSFLCASMNRQLKLCQTDDEGRSKKLENLFTCTGGEGKICGLEMTEGSIVTAVESGLIKLWSIDGEDKKLDLSVGENLCRMRASCSSSNLIATGGKENALKVWDLQSEDPTKPVFASKNVKNDWLQLRVPIWETDFRFFENDSLISTCTGNHFVRLYDRRSQCRRPVVQIDWSDHPFTAMSLTCNERQVIVGSSRGFMGLFDLRSPGKLVHAFKGFAGSISAIEAHKTKPFVASCGLDRFLLVHHVQNKKMVHKVYCKAHLNTLLLKNDLSIFEDTKKQDSSSDSECESDVDDAKHTISKPEENTKIADDVWAKMVVVKDTKLKRKLDEKASEEENTRTSPHAIKLKKQKCRSSVLKRKSDGDQQGLLETGHAEPEKKSKTIDSVDDICRTNVHSSNAKLSGKRLRKRKIKEELEN